MKKRLYWIIFLSLSVFFLFLLAVIAFFHDFYPFDNIKNTISIIAIVVVAIAISSYIINSILMKESVKPLDEFINYISKIIVNDPSIRELDKDIEDNVLNMLKRNGYEAEEIEKGLAALLEHHNARREFSANVTHELKSPLTSINGYAEMIATGMTNPEDSAEFARRINSEGNRLLRMIDETIQLSKIDNNYIKSGSFSEFDIGKLIEENIASFKGQIKKKEMKINFKYNRVQFYGNSKLIYDVIRNLISNAIKYSSNEEPYLNIRLEDRLDKIRIYFEDNGIGISDQDQARIFERFYVADKSRGNKTGTGLGLSLVKNIINYHRGSVSVKSKLGEGSTFKVELPKLSENDYIS